MSTLLFTSAYNPMLDDNGVVLEGGFLYFYAPGTEDFKTVYADASLSASLGNPVELDGNGRAVVYLSGDYDLRIADRLDNQVAYPLNINPDSAGAQTGVNLVTNGSFEVNTSGDGKTPDGWTLTETGTADLDSDSATGSLAMEFISAGSGGGNVISEDFFEVAGGDILTVSFYLKSSVVDVRNLVQMHWYDSSSTLISSSTIYDESAANPTSYTRQTATVSAPATARFAKIQLFGAHPSDSTPGTTFFDGVEVIPSSIGGGFISGTRLSFPQSAAPAGWTKLTTWNDRYMRVVSGSGGGTAGANSYVITGLSGTGNLPNHTHGSGNLAGNHNVSYAIDGADLTPGGVTVYNHNSISVNAGNTANPNSNPTINVNISSSGAWKPPALNTIVCSKD